MRKLEETNFNENSWVRIKYHAVKVVIIWQGNISGWNELCLPRLSNITLWMKEINVSFYTLNAPEGIEEGWMNWYSAA